MVPHFLQYMTITECAYCHNTVAVEIAQNPRTVRCTTCGLYRLFPRMTRDGQVAFVEHHYGKLEIKKWGNPLERAANATWEVEKLRNCFPSLFRSGGQVLDVGCAEGGFVAALQQAGVRASGLEPQERLVALGRKFGLDLYKGRFEAQEIPAELCSRTFDLVCFRESIYYMPDLRETFDLLRAYLKPGGRLYIKSHVGTSIYYWLNRNFAKRYGILVAGMPTPEALLHILNREGYRVDEVAVYPKLGFSLLPVLLSGLESGDWPSPLRRLLNLVSARCDVVLGKLLPRIAHAFAAADCIVLLASRAQC